MSPSLGGSYKGCLFFQKSIFSNHFFVLQANFLFRDNSLILTTAFKTSETIATSTRLFLLTLLGRYLYELPLH